MGLRYVAYRVGFEVRSRTGLLKRKFPVDPPFKNFISLTTWRRKSSFFGISKSDPPPSKPFPAPDLESVLNGGIQFFSALKKDLGKDYDWVTNPETNFKYNADQHWTEIQDFDQGSGDIKFVWEKSRFSYLYELIRHDHLKGKDHSEWVLKEINSWLDSNKINCGPNYKCSQEISLRILNWTYAINYYKNSIHLTEELFDRIIHSIYWQLKHIYSNIDFSRIAVRNNHALTETLTLYLSSLYYPFFPEAKLWGKKGKKWFEEEIDYQIYSDGTFLQFSMNYHRVVIQLLTWAFVSADYFNDRFSDNTYLKAYKSIDFLFSCQDESSGWLPNYGNNDGALFFKFNSCDFRDYRPQLNALHLILTGEGLYPNGSWDEDLFWMKSRKIKFCNFVSLKHHDGWKAFEKGGYFILRENDTLTFIRCGKHKDRPAQADNLHLDIWCNGENVVYDSGTYKYNTEASTLKYFMGTKSHNTVMLGEADQMLKGSRFIWYNWSQEIKSGISVSDNWYTFLGTISVFRNIDPNITHTRKVIKTKGKNEWIVEDVITCKPKDILMNQIWHILPIVKLRSTDEMDTPIDLKIEDGWRSDYYGVRENAAQYMAQTFTNKIITTLCVG